MREFECHALTEARLADYLAFFDHRAFKDNPRWAGCYCHYPLHDPARIDWHAQTAQANRAAITARIQDGTAGGVLAYRDGQVVGFCNAGPWRQFPMLRDVPQDAPDTVGVIFCFIVAPEARGQGVARALLEAACERFRTMGLAAAQAKPRREAQGDAENHLGPLSLYLDAGFRVVTETDDGGVIVRKELR